METAGSAEENCDASSVLPRGFFLNSCFIVVLVTFFSKLLHSLVGKFARQPRIISELVVGVIIGHIPFLRKLVGPVMADGFEVIEHFSSSLYMFSVGLEMEPLAILQPPGPEAKIAFAGICSTSSLFFLSYYTLNHVGVFRDQMEKVVIRERSLIAFVLMFTAASSPIITRMITELKLGQTDIGRLAIRSGQANDLVCTTFMAINMLFRASRKINILIVAASVAAELIFGRFVLWYLIKWANKRNPVGKKIRGLDMTIVVVITQVLCHLSWLFNYDARVNSFLIGLVLPRHGHVPNYLVGRVSYILTSYILPPYVALSATKSYAVPKQGESLGSDIARMTILNLVSLVGKLIGTLIACICNGLHWLEAITLSVTLNMKGHFHIIFSVLALDRGLMKEGSFIVVVVTVLASIVYVPFTISFIIKKVRKVKGGKARLMGLQWYNSASELRITVGLIKPQNVVSSMTLIELIRSGSDSRTLVYTVDMIELTEPRRAALVYKQGTDSVTVADDEVIELREEIGLELKSQTDGCEGIAVSRSLAISSFSDMHDNICCCAQDTLAVLILLPFHRGLKPDGSLDEGHPGFRTVNENVLRHAPCSTGILVDRGLGRGGNNHSTSEAQVTNVAMVFIGGADDREALACAGIMSHHPAVRMLVVRLIQNKEAMAAEGRRMLGPTAQREIEWAMGVDDEYFARFYEEFVTNGRVEYREKMVMNGAEAVRALKEMAEDECRRDELLIVGQGTERKSMLTAGMVKWCEYPELGPIGDILASSDFPSTASVLVVQQRNQATRSDFIISDEFMPM